MWGFTKIQQRALLFLLASFGAGCLILIYRRQQQPPPVAPAMVAQFQSLSRRLAPDTAKADSMPRPPARGKKNTARLRVNINTATAAELTALPGIGATLAQRIIAYREQHGKFQRVEDLGKVKGVGKRKLEALRQRVVLD